MGGLTSVATTAIQAISAANSVIGMAQNYQDRSGSRDYRELKQRNELALRDASEQAALQKERMRIESEAANTERRAALRRAMAKQRAQFGASGTGSSGGSAQAVLLGLFDESEDERAQRESLDQIKSSIIDQNVTGQQRLNTLVLTQLKERNRLNGLGAKLDGAQNLGSYLLK